MEIEKNDICGVSIACSEANYIAKLMIEHRFSKPLLFTFVNPGSYFFLKNDSSYFGILDRFDFIYPDGVGILVGARVLGIGKHMSRVSFDSTSAAPYVFETCISNSFEVCFVGSKPGVADAAASIFKERHSNLNVLRSFSGYGSDPEDAIEYIRDKNVDVVVCSMGAPKQEEFLLRLADSGWAGIGFTCGGYLDQSVSSYDYYPEIVNKLNVRFLYRLIKEPRRLWKRYFFDYTCFYSVVWTALLKKVKL